MQNSEYYNVYWTSLRPLSDYHVKCWHGAAYSSAYSSAYSCGTCRLLGQILQCLINPYNTCNSLHGQTVNKHHKIRFLVAEDIDSFSRLDKSQSKHQNCDARAKNTAM